MVMNLTQADLDDIVKRRIEKSQRHKWRQLQQLLQENRELHAELDAYKRRTFVERLTDLFRPSRRYRPVAVNTHTQG